jgi:hypothetical protein
LLSTILLCAIPVAIDSPDVTEEAAALRSRALGSANLNGVVDGRDDRVLEDAPKMDDRLPCAQGLKAKLLSRSGWGKRRYHVDTEEAQHRRGDLRRALVLRWTNVAERNAELLANVGDDRLTGTACADTDDTISAAGEGDEGGKRDETFSPTSKGTL